MKEYTFPYYISYGRNDSVDNEITCKLSNKDAKRLENSAHEGGRFRLDEDSEINDIYNKIYEKIRSTESDFLLANPEIVQDWLSWDDDFNPSKEITGEDVENYLDELKIGINYPCELQNLERTTKLGRKKNYQSITLDIEEAKDFLLNEDNKKNYIVYVDEGKTLFWVPIKYSGVFVVNSDVREIKKFTFDKRDNITEIVIQDGLEALGEGYFSGCKNLVKVLVPKSVKEIGIRAFGGCRELKDIELSEGLTEIHPQAFDSCYNLKSLTIPSSVKELSSLIAGGGRQDFRDFYFLGKDTEITGVWAYLWEYTKVLHVLPGSLAEKFAVENKLRYEYITK